MHVTDRLLRQNKLWTVFGAEGPGHHSEPPSKFNTMPIINQNNTHNIN